MIFKRNIKSFLERESPSSAHPSAHSAPVQGAVHGTEVATAVTSPASLTNYQQASVTSYSANRPPEAGRITPLAERYAVNSEPLRQEQSRQELQPRDSSHENYPREDFPHYRHASSSHTLAPMQENLEASDDLPETVLGEGVSFKGELGFKRYLRIDGEFEGQLNSKGKLFIGRTGSVKSHIKLRSAIIEGRLDGDINVEELLELRGSACIFGNISARYLRVDDGVTLVGHVRINPEGQPNQESSREGSFYATESSNENS